MSIKELIEKKRRRFNKLSQNVLRLKLPLGNYWVDILKTSLAECQRELKQVGDEIECLTEFSLSAVELRARDEEIESMEAELASVKRELDKLKPGTRVVVVVTKPKPSE